MPRVGVVWVLREPPLKILAATYAASDSRNVDYESGLPFPYRQPPFTVNTSFLGSAYGYYGRATESISLF